MRKVFVSFLVIMVLVVGMAQVFIPRSETVYVAGCIWGPATSWNFCAPSPTWGTRQFLYLPLFIYNVAEDAWLPMIGEDYTFINDKTIWVRIRKEARWSDSTPITAKDVVYSYNLQKKLGMGPNAGWDSYVESVKAISDKIVEFKARADALNYFQFLTYSLTAFPAPSHVYKDLEEKGVSIKDWKNDNPVAQVVSGPYKLYHSDPNMVAYKRIDDWWGKDIFGLPKPKYIAHVIYKDNPSASLALERGDVDWAGLFIPSVWEMWEKKKKPIGTWFKQSPYFMPGGVILLYVNNTKMPLNDINVKKAIAYAIPYVAMIKKAYFGYGAQAHPSMVIDVFETYRKYIDYDLARKVWGSEDGKVKTDLEKADAILDKAGFKRGKDGIRVSPDGKRLGTYTLAVPYGWTDWMMMCQIIAKNLKEIGIDVKTEFPDFTVWWNKIIKGEFDMVICWSAGPGFDHPFNVYRGVLDYRLSGPVGEVRPAGDWERYKNDKIIELLDKAVSTLNLEERKKVYFEIQKIIYEDLPAIPMFYGAHWYEYNESIWENWPDEESPWWFPSAPWQDFAQSLPIIFGIYNRGKPQPFPAWMKLKEEGGMMVPTSKIFEDLMATTK